MNGNLKNLQSLTGKIKSFKIDTTLTKKGMCAESKAVGDALAAKVNISDIIDDLLSVASDKPLSANQGRLLKKLIDEIDPHYAENVLYNDTNVKDALDKVSKAENIAYDDEKSVQGAIDEIKGAIGDTSTNLIPYPYVISTYEYNGMSYTELGDGRIKANGSTSDGASGFYLQNYVPQKLNNKKVILSLKSTSGLASAFFRFLGKGNTYIGEYDFSIIKQNGEITIDVPSADNYDYWTVELFYDQGITVVDDIVEIMIRPASIKDSTYKSPVTSINSLVCNVEKISITNTFTSISTSLQILWTYTASRKCLISGTFRSTHNNGYPIQLSLYRNGVGEPFAHMSCDSPSDKTLPFCLMLEEGQQIIARAKYNNDTSNSYIVEGCVQYLE